MDQYGKYASFLTLFMMTLGTAWLCARGAELDRYVAANVFDAEAVEVKEIFPECETEEQSGEVQETVLEMPARDVEQPEEKEECELSSRDYETLLKIVEAEAGTEDQKGKILVANVVLNRVDAFKNCRSGSGDGRSKRKDTRCKCGIKPGGRWAVSGYGGRGSLPEGRRRLSVFTGGGWKAQSGRGK